MKGSKIFAIIMLTFIALGVAGTLVSCKSTKRKGCGCGADLNRMYRPRR